MSIKDIEMLLRFIGGLGLFLYGIKVITDGLQKFTSNKMKQLLNFITHKNILPVLFGTAVIGIIQGAYATTSMIVGLVNGGIIQLAQVLGVIMGANLGTSVIPWIVSMNEWGGLFNLTIITPLFVGVGVFILLFLKSAKKKSFGEICIGFGTLLIGINFMMSSIEPYQHTPFLLHIFQTLGQYPLLALLVGIVTAGLLQSSAASIAIIQVFAMNHMANWESAVFIVLGQAIGMCITTLIVSSGTQKFAKRVSVIHLLLNVVSVVLVGLAMLFLFFVMRGLGESKISSVDISLFYTIYNIASIFLLAPFASYFVQVSGIIIKDSEAEVIEAEAEDKEEVITLRHLDERILESPSFALENAVLEVVHMGDLAVANTKLAFEAAKENNLDKIHQVYKNEKTINNLEKLIIEYLVKISNLSLTEKQHTMINNLFYSVSDLERVGDHAENIAELAEFKCNNNIIFTESAQNEIAEIMDIGLKSIEYAVLARREGNVEHIRKVMKYEDMVDNMEEELREKHIERLSLRQCEADSGIVFLDIISNLERISDHANNIVGYVNDEME